MGNLIIVCLYIAQKIKVLYLNKFIIILYELIKYDKILKKNIVNNSRIQMS